MIKNHYQWHWHFLKFIKVFFVAYYMVNFYNCAVSIFRMQGLIKLIIMLVFYILSHFCPFDLT